MSLRDLGWNDYFQQQWETEGCRFAPARVVEAQRGACTIVTETDEMLAEVTGRFRHGTVRDADFPVVGDWVDAETHTGGNRAMIHTVLGRRTKLSRKAAHEDREQVLVANVDVVLVVSSLNAEFNPRRLERYLGMIRESGAMPVLLLSKADLCADPWKVAAQAERSMTGVPVHILSGVTGEGIRELAPYFGTGSTGVLVGSSGVGKSTLINALLGNEIQSTKEIRSSDTRGRHTTTARKLFRLPAGGVLIDTPGIRELHLWSDEGLESTFEDIGRFAAECRYRDCRHETEPGCAVRAAIDSGELDPERLANFGKLRKEMQYLERRHDPVARAEEQKRWKQIHKAMRQKKPRLL